MNIKLYILHSDTPQSGTTLSVFTSNAKRLAHMRDIMRADIQTATESEPIRRIRRLLRVRKIESAWIVWRDLIDDHYYTRFESAVNVPANVKIEVTGGVAEVTRCTPGVQVTIQDHDNH